MDRTFDHPFMDAIRIGNFIDFRSHKVPSISIRTWNMATKPNVSLSHCLVALYHWFILRLPRQRTWYAWGQTKPHTREEMPSDYFLKEAREKIPNLIQRHTKQRVPTFVKSLISPTDNSSTSFERCVWCFRLVSQKIGKSISRCLQWGSNSSLKKVSGSNMFINTITHSFLFSVYDISSYNRSASRTPEDRGFLDSNNKLVYDPPTDTRQRGVILLSYFTSCKTQVILCIIASRFGCHFQPLQSQYGHDFQIFKL